MTEKYLVVGDGICAPMMALCLRLNKLNCDLLMTNSASQQDQASIVLTPSSTQILGDVFDMPVPSGSVVSRFLSFDHAGNDMSDIDLNKFRLTGVSPTFYACQRNRIRDSLISLCRSGKFECKILPAQALLDYTSMDVTNGSAIVHTAYGKSNYTKIICTARKPNSIPFIPKEKNVNDEITTLEPIQRWIELSIPAMSSTDQGEFIPGSQELVEIVTNSNSKMIVKPILLGTKLFYNVLLSMKETTKSPQAQIFDPTRYWNEFIAHWSNSKPEYINHTMFKPIMRQIQLKSDPKRYLVYKTPCGFSNRWTSHDGAVLRVGPAAYSSYADTVDIVENNHFHDCYFLAKKLADDRSKAVEWLQNTRKEEVVKFLQQHSLLNEFTFKERGQLAYMGSRFKMKFLGGFKKKWRALLKPMVSVL